MIYVIITERIKLLCACDLGKFHLSEYKNPNLGTISRINHLLIGLIEHIPILGGLVGLVEVVAYYIFFDKAAQDVLAEKRVFINAFFTSPLYAFRIWLTHFAALFTGLSSFLSKFLLPLPKPEEAIKRLIEFYDKETKNSNTKQLSVTYETNVINNSNGIHYKVRFCVFFNSMIQKYSTRLKVLKLSPPLTSTIHLPNEGSYLFEQENTLRFFL